MTEVLQSSVCIRAGQFEDLGDIAKLLTFSFYPQHSLWHWLTPVLQLWTYQDLQSRYYAKASKYSWLVGIGTNHALPSSSPQLLASVEVSVRPLSPRSVLSGPVPYLSNLAVAANHRRQGLGRQLLLACEPIVQEWGWQELYLHALDTNIPALKLYKSIGYKVRQNDSHWSASWLGQPQRLLLHKQL